MRTPIACIESYIQAHPLKASSSVSQRLIAKSHTFSINRTQVQAARAFHYCACMRSLAGLFCQGTKHQIISTIIIEGNILAPDRRISLTCARPPLCFRSRIDQDSLLHRFLVKSLRVGLDSEICAIQVILFPKGREINHVVKVRM